MKEARLYFLLFLVGGALPFVFAANTTTYYNRWNINNTFGLHTGTDPEARFGNWSDRYNGTENGTYLRAALFLEQHNVSVLNIIIRVESGKDHKENVSTFLNTLDVNNITLDVIVDYEPNVTENQTSHIASLRQVINDTKKNATHFYPNLIGISIDYEWLDGINKTTELNFTVEEARNITVNESLTFFPIWFEDDVRDAIVELTNKTGVVPLYDGLISSTTQILADGSNSFFDDHVSHMAANGFPDVGILPVSSETGSLKKRQAIAAKTWIIYYNAAKNQNISHAIFASGNVLLEDPLSMYTTDAIVDTQNLSGAVYDLPAVEFTNAESVFIYGMLPNNNTVYDLKVVRNQTFSNQTSIPARVAGFNTSLTTHANRSFFVTEHIISNPPLGQFDIIIDVDNDSVFDSGLDAIDDDNISGAGFVVTNALWLLDFVNTFQFDNLNITSHNNLSQVVNSSIFIDGVFLAYNGTNTSQRPFGKLFDDFSFLDFHLFNKTSNTKADLYLTDNGYILKALNLTYDYENTGDDELHLRRQTEFLGNGSDFRPYDYIGMKLNVDAVDKHQMKFRITAANETNLTDEVDCDTPYRTVQETGWIDFTASMNDLSSGCNVSNVHMLSIFVNDVTNADTDTGSMLFDEVYLRTNTRYYVDDFEQYLATDIANWENTSPGDNVSLLITNSSAANGTQSINFTYNYSSGQENFTLIRNDMPFTLDLNNYQTVGFYFKADKTNTHSLSAAVYDNSSDACVSTTKNATTTDWELFEWNVTDLAAGCNLSFINGPAFNVSLANSTFNGTGSVFVDSYFLTKNVSERIEFNFINQSIRVNNTISWEICVNATFRNCSDTSTFNYTEYNFDSSATYGNDSGNLTDYLNDLNRLQKETQSFLRANLREQELMGDIVTSLKNKDYSAAIINASAIDYTITNFTYNTTTPNRTYYVVEHTGTNKGWGYYVYYDNASINDLIVSIPHPLNDVNTRLIGTNLYFNVSAEWMLLASAHRDTQFNELAEPVSDDNRQHPYYAAMLNLSNATTRWLDVHGFAVASHAGYPNVTISQGNSTQSELNLLFSENLSLQNVTADVFNGTNYPDLAGGRNVIGKHIRSINADFIHSEISNTIRNNETLRDSYIIGAKNTFNPADEINPTITLNSPTNNTGDSDANVTFEYNVTDLSQVENCSIILNSVVNVTNTSVTKNIFQNFSLINAPVGEFNWSVNCTDSSGNQGASNQRVVYIIPANEFSGDTTDLTAVNISNISALTIDQPNWGKINFSSFMDIRNNTDLNSHINISENRIEVNSSALSHLNRSATLYLYNLTFSDPRVLLNDAVCASSICTEVSYSGGTYTFNVTQFSIYSAEETPSASSSSSGSSSSGSSSSGGGTSSICGDGVCISAYGETCASNTRTNTNFGACFKDCGLCSLQNKSLRDIPKNGQRLKEEKGGSNTTQKNSSLKVYFQEIQDLTVSLLSPGPQEKKTAWIILTIILGMVIFIFYKNKKNKEK